MNGSIAINSDELRCLDLHSQQQYFKLNDQYDDAHAFAVSISVPVSSNLLINVHIVGAENPKKFS